MPHRHEVALDLGLKIMKATEADLGPNAINPDQKKLMVEMVEKQGRLGRKNSKGFYDTPRRARVRRACGRASRRCSRSSSTLTRSTSRS